MKWKESQAKKEYGIPVQNGISTSEIFKTSPDQRTIILTKSKVVLNYRRKIDSAKDAQNEGNGCCDQQR